MIKKFNDEFFLLLSPTPTTICVSLEIANKPCCKLMCSLFVLCCNVYLTNQPSLCLFWRWSLTYFYLLKSISIVAIVMVSAKYKMHARS